MATGDLEPAVWRIDIYELKPDTPFAGVITDLSNLYTSDLSITKQRNYPDEIRFTLDLKQLEERAGSLNVLSREVLEPYKHKVRCYRNNKFVAQGIVVKTTANLNNQAKNTLEVQCVDTLGLLEKRLIHQDYGEGSWADFAKEVVMDAQHEPNRIYNYAWEGDGVSVDNAWFRGWKYTPGETALRDFPEWEPNHLYSMYDTCTHDAKFWEAKEHAFYSGETFSESNWTLLGILDSETGDVAGVYGVWREDDEEPGPTGTALGGWGGTSSCHMTANTFTVNNGGDKIKAISTADSMVSTSLVTPYFATPRLPQEYQEVKYIDSSGTQWMNLGVVPTKNTVIQIKFMPFEAAGGATIGTLYSTGDVDDYRFFNAGSAYYFDMPGGSGSGNRITGGSCPANIKQELEVGNFYVKYINGSNIISGTALSSFTASGPLALNTYGAKANISSNRWYYVKIFEGEEKIRDLVPCYRKADDVVGMYDLVNNKFYTNDGLGVFTRGGKIIYSSRLPEDYVETMYLQNTYGISSSTQLSPYIDTGLNSREYGERVKINTVVEFDTSTSTSVWHAIVSASYGVYNGTWYWAPQFNFALNGEGKIGLEYTTSSATYNASIEAYFPTTLSMTKHNLILDATKNAPTLSVDGTVYTAPTTRASGSKYGASANLCVFARNFQNPENADNHRRGSYGSPMKLFYMQITDANGNMVRDFVPCKRVSDGKPGLYDLAHGRFYSNANASAAGDFTSGPIVPYDNLTSTQVLSVERSYVGDMERGDYRAIQAIDTEKFAKKFAETYPEQVAAGNGPAEMTFYGTLGDYSCSLSLAPFGGGSTTGSVVLWTGETIEDATIPLAEWGLTVYKTSVWE